MIGTPANKEILREAGLLGDVGRQAGPGDLVIGLRAKDAAAAEAAMAEARRLLDQPRRAAAGGAAWQPRTLRGAVQQMPDANLALISVPGDFAAAEARKALRRGLNVMIFSDNVPLEQEIALKREARDLGLIVMGPDCGTAIIAGVPHRLRQRRSAGRYRHHRRFRHRHPGGFLPHRQRWARHFACHRHRRTRSFGGGRRHRHADGDRSLRSRPGDPACRADLQAAGAADRQAGARSREPEPQAVYGLLHRRCRRRLDAGECQARRHADGSGRERAGAQARRLSRPAAEAGRRPADPRPLLRRHLVLGGAADPAAIGADCRVQRSDPGRCRARRDARRPRPDRPRRRPFHARPPAPDDRAGNARCAARGGPGGQGRRRRAARCHPGLGRACGPGGPAGARARRPAGRRPRHRRLRDRHGGRPAGPLGPSAQAHGGRRRRGAIECRRRRTSLCSWSSDVDLDLGRARRALCRAPCVCPRGRRVLAQPPSRGGGRLHLHRRSEHRPRSTQRGAGPRRLDATGHCSAADRNERVHRSGCDSHRWSCARHNTRRALAPPSVAVGSDDAKEFCRRCNDCSVSLPSRLPSMALPGPCWAWRATSTRLSRGWRSRAWSDCGPGWPRGHRHRPARRRRSICWGSVPASRRRATMFCAGCWWRCTRSGRPTWLARSTPRSPRRRRPQRRPSPAHSCAPRPRDWGARPCMRQSLRSSRDRSRPSPAASRLWAASATPRAGTRLPVPCSCCRHSAQRKGTAPESHGPGFPSKLDRAACRMRRSARRGFGGSDDERVFEVP